MNSIVLQGRLAQDVLFMKGNGENSYDTAKFNLAVERYNSRSGERSAQFIPCVVFGNRAGVIQNYVHKGDRLLVRGSLSYSTRKLDYVDPEGKPIYSVLCNVVVDEFDLIQGAKNEEVPLDKPKRAQYN